MRFAWVLNLDAELKLNRMWTVMLDGTLNDARVKGEESDVVVPATLAAAVGPTDVPLRPSFHIEPLEPGSHVPNVARWLGRVGLEAALSPSLVARGTLRFSGPYTPIGEPDVETQSYGVVDVGTSVRVPPLGAVLDLELQNAFDTKYQEIRASGFLNPGAPRTLRAALRFAERP